MTLAPRVVVVQRRSELETLVAWHGTKQQAAFFLEERGGTLDELEARHAALNSALHHVSAAIPADWRRAVVERAELSRFVFSPEDIIVVVGQDGLVANVAKYLHGQPVVGINPEPERNPGVLVPHAPSEIQRLFAGVLGEDARPVERRSMVEATLDNGVSLSALNEIFVGHRSHQSARYMLEAPDAMRERHSSSGVIVGTGTGATGWTQSIWRERRSALILPEPTDLQLCWFVREAWPSPATGTDLTEGLIDGDQALGITAETDLVVFGDGIESDALGLAVGQIVRLSISSRALHLVR